MVCALGKKPRFSRDWIRPGEESNSDTSEEGEGEGAASVGPAWQRGKKMGPSCRPERERGGGTRAACSAWAATSWAGRGSGPSEGESLVTGEKRGLGLGLVSRGFPLSFLFSFFFNSFSKGVLKQKQIK